MLIPDSTEIDVFMPEFKLGEKGLVGWQGWLLSVKRTFFMLIFLKSRRTISCAYLEFEFCLGNTYLCPF